MREKKRKKKSFFKLILDNPLYKFLNSHLIIAIVSASLGGVGGIFCYYQKKEDKISQSIDELKKQELPPKQKKVEINEIAKIGASTYFRFTSFMNLRNLAIKNLLYLLNRDDSDIREYSANSFKEFGEEGKNALYEHLVDDKPLDKKYRLEALDALEEIDKQHALNAAKQLVEKWENHSGTITGHKEEINYEDDKFICFKKMILKFYSYGISLDHLYLPGIDLHEENLQGIKFDNSCLKGANFKNVTSLKDASFDGADLEGAAFSGATTDNANFSNAKLKGVNFDGAVLSEAIFSSSDFTEKQFEEASLKGEELRQVISENFHPEPNVHKFCTPPKAENTVDWINKLLRYPCFFNILREKNEKARDSISHNSDIKDLVDEIYRYSNKEINFNEEPVSCLEIDLDELDKYQQYNIMKLNRLLLEGTFNIEVPKLFLKRKPQSCQLDRVLVNTMGQTKNISIKANLE